MSILVSATIALANDMSCLCPSDRFEPLCSSSVSYPLGSLMMNSCAPTALAACTTSSLVAVVLLYRMFSYMVLENRYGSCSTIPMLSPSEDCLSSWMFFPLTKISPSQVS